MNNPQAKQIINNLYDLLLEANINRPNEDVLAEANSVSDAFVEYQISRFKRTMTKYQAISQKNKFAEIQLQFNQLLEIGIEKLAAMFQPEEKLQYQRCFNKFKELTKADEQSILQDSELLLFIKKMKEKIEDNGNKSIS